MSREKREVVTCDRCGEQVELKAGTMTREFGEWGRVVAMSNGERPVVGSDEKPADLCGGCLNALERFVREDVVDLVVETDEAAEA